jgi:uncharacterized protein (DUF1501 family)
MSGRCCNEYSRSAVLRRAAAQAGAGLPAIEPGMPLPAGTGLDRKSFLAKSVGLALSVYGATRLVPGLLDEGIARAATFATAERPILVSVFMSGGVDSLSLLYPAGDPDYRRLRPRLALPASAGAGFSEDDRLRWHPSAASLATLHGEGKLTVLPAVGYTNADQSHFTSRHYWEVGATDPGLRTGWLGRYLDRAGTTDNPLQGLSLDDELSPALASARVPVAALRGADQYSFGAPGVWGEVHDRMIDAIGSFGSLAGAADPALAQAGAIATQADQLRRQLAQFKTRGSGAARFGSTVPYPEHRSQFPQRLAGLAAMLSAGLPLHCVALNAYGMFDTHSDQPDQLASALKVTADTLLAFQRDLESRGLADRVLTLVWSEFGRRAEENGSNGTDHGAAGTAFLLGTRVRGRMIGEFPGLKKGLDEQGNLRATADYRALYSSLLEQWLGHDADGVVAGAARFDRYRLLR